jgi:maltose O-acetyltransferase
MFREGAKLYLLKLAGWIPVQSLRTSIYRNSGMGIGVGTIIYHGCEVRAPRAIQIGSWTSIGDGCILDGRGGLTIGDSVNFSTGVWVWTAEHNVNDPGFATTSAPVAIEDHAWVSCRAVILPGVTIGRGAVVAAGAVVTKSVEPFDIVGGVPAKRIGRRSTDLHYKLSSCYAFW